MKVSCDFEPQPFETNSAENDAKVEVGLRDFLNQGKDLNFSDPIAFELGPTSNPIIPCSPPFPLLHLQQVFLVDETNNQFKPLLA